MLMCQVIRVDNIDGSCFRYQKSFMVWVGVGDFNKECVCILIFIFLIKLFFNFSNVFL